MTGTMSRRDFVQAAAAGATLIVAIPRAAGARTGATPAENLTTAAFLELDTQGWVSVKGYRAEMGQGVHTAVAMIVADELEADWKRVRVVPTVADSRLDMATGGSRSIRGQFQPLRIAGAAAREMLLAAAALEWKVDRASLVARQGVVLHPSTGRRLGYGQLVARAGTLPVPEAPPLKPAEKFTLIGTRVPRVDTPAKVDGSARFGMDVRTPGLRYAVLVRPPVLGAAPARIDETGARSIAGVLRVVPVQNAMAVVARHTWAAIEGARRLKIE